MPDYEWTRDDRGVDTYSKDYPFDAGDKHNFEWVLKNLAELCDTFPDVAGTYQIATGTNFICFKGVTNGR